MRPLRVWLLRLRGVFRASRDEQFAEEIAAHLQMHVRDLIESGLSPSEARRRAIMKLGGVESTRQAYRDTEHLPWQNRCCRSAEEAHQSLDVLSHRCQEEVFAHEPESAQTQAAQSDLILQFREQGFHRLSLPLCCGELWRVDQLPRTLSGWFVLLSGQFNFPASVTSGGASSGGWDLPRFFWVTPAASFALRLRTPTPLSGKRECSSVSRTNGAQRTRSHSTMARVGNCIFRNRSPEKDRAVCSNSTRVMCRSQDFTSIGSRRLCPARITDDETHSLSSAKANFSLQ
jgi:hypothetical protein